MKRTFRLTEADIKAAILCYVVKEMSITDSKGMTVSLSATEARDAMDRVSYGHTVSAVVEEK